MQVFLALVFVVFQAHRLTSAVIDRGSCKKCLPRRSRRSLVNAGPNLCFLRTMQPNASMPPLESGLLTLLTRGSNSCASWKLRRAFGLMIIQAPDSQLRDKKRVAGKVVPRQDSGRSQSCAALRSCVRGSAAQFSKQVTPKLCARPNFQEKVAGLCGRSASGGNACPATWLVSEFGRRGSVGSRSSRRLQLARHAHNKCIASGQQKRSVGHVLFVCGSAERYSNCNRCFRDDSAQPRGGNNNDNTSMQQQ